MRQLNIFIFINLFSVSISALKAESPVDAPSPTVTQCGSAIATKLATILPTAPPPRESGRTHLALDVTSHPDKNDEHARLSLLMQKLQTTPSDPNSFRRSFDALAAADPLTRSALRYLEQKKIPFQLKTSNEEPYCGRAGALYFPAPRERVVMCIVGGGRQHNLQGMFIHEVVHAMQHNQDSPTSFLFYQSSNGREPSRTALNYTMSPAFVDAQSEEIRESNRLNHSIREENKDTLKQLDEFFAELEKYYYFSEQNGRLNLTPKTVPGENLDAWYALLERKVFTQRRTGNATDPLTTPFIAAIIRNWAAANPPANFPTIRARMESLVEFAKRRYANLANEPQGAQIKQILKNNFMSWGRILTHLGTYCMETQTHFFNTLNDINFGRELSAFEACQPIANEYLSAAIGKRGTETFSVTAAAAEMDPQVERYANWLVSSSPFSYGGLFDSLHGYEGHSHIFNSENCRRFRADFKEAIPERDQHRN